ncbi:hypothetical protein D3C84_999600 [compost metagenome]
MHPAVKIRKAVIVTGIKLVTNIFVAITFIPQINITNNSKLYIFDFDTVILLFTTKMEKREERLSASLFHPFILQ